MLRKDPMAKRPESDVAGSTLIERDKTAPDPVPAHGAEEAPPGGTAHVRVDRAAPRQAPLPPSRRAGDAPPAPRKGLQVSLPEDEPAPAPPPRRAPPPPEEKQGRRGAWWDATHAGQPE